MSRNSIIDRVWPWLGIGIFLVIVVGGYFRPELGASEQIASLKKLLGVSEQVAHFVVLGARKSLHVAGYGFLAAAVLTILSVRLPAGRWQSYAAMGVVVCVAATDELIQSIIPWRTGLGADALLDICGGALGLGLVALVRARRRSSRPEGSQS